MRQRRRFGILLVALAGMGGLASAMAPGAQGAQTAAASPRAAAGTRPAAERPGAPPGFGNPHGHFPVPPAGRAVNTSHPNHVIGDGRPASCTSAAVVRAVAAGGIITFDCGKQPVTILMTATAKVPKTRHLVVLDGGGAIFYVVDSGWGKLTLNESHLHNNPSGQFQTFPGIYDNIDGHDTKPVMIHSTDT